MAAEAEAAREARAKVIAAEGEQKASRALKEAAEVIAESPAALQVLFFQLNIYIYHFLLKRTDILIIVLTCTRDSTGLINDARSCDRKSFFLKIRAGVLSLFLNNNIYSSRKILLKNLFC